MLKNIVLFAGNPEDNFFENLEAGKLGDQLSEMAFKPCGTQDERTVGFSAPLPARKGEDEQLIFDAGNGIFYFAVMTESKVLPSGVVNEQVKERVAEIEEKEDRRMSKKERTAIKEEIRFDLLSRAFTVKGKTTGYIDTLKQLVVIDAASLSKAEDIVSLLRKAMGSLPVVPMKTLISADLALPFTQWVLDKGETDALNNLFELGEKASFVSTDAGKIQYRDESLLGGDVELILGDGKQVCEIQLLSLEQEGLSFMMTTEFQLKAIKANIDTEEELEDFIAIQASEMTLSALLVRKLVLDLMQVLSLYIATVPE